MYTSKDTNRQVHSHIISPSVVGNPENSVYKLNQGEQSWTQYMVNFAKDMFCASQPPAPLLALPQSEQEWKVRRSLWDSLITLWQPDFSVDSVRKKLAGLSVSADELYEVLVHEVAPVIGKALQQTQSPLLHLDPLMFEFQVFENSKKTESWASDWHHRFRNLAFVNRRWQLVESALFHH